MKSLTGSLFLFILLAAALFSIVPVTAHSQSDWENRGPTGGLVIDLQTGLWNEPRLVALGGSGTVYERSASDNAWLWRGKVPALTSGRLITSPQVDGRVWVIDGSGHLYTRSTTNDNFMMANGNWFFTDVADAPSNDDHMFAIGEDPTGDPHLLFSSDGNGLNWTDRGQIEGGQLLIYGGDQDTLYVTGGMTLNGGQNWLPWDGNLDGYRLFRDPRRNRQGLFRMRLSQGGVYSFQYSWERGEGSWDAVRASDSEFYPAVDEEGNALVFNESAVFGVTPDRGESWDLLEIEDPEEVIDEHRPTAAATLDDFYISVVVASTDGIVIYDSDGNPTDYSQGLFENEVRELTFLPGSDDQTLLVACRDGIYRSTNGGSSWSQRLIGDVFDVAASEPDGGRVYAAGDSGIWRSDDGGLSFNFVDDQPSPPIMALAVAGVWDGMTVLGRTEDAVLRSEDGGETWSEVLAEPADADFLVLGVNPEGSRVYSAAGDEVFISENHGDTWTTISLAGALGGDVRDYVEADSMRFACSEDVVVASATLTGGWVEQDDFFEAPLGTEFEQVAAGGEGETVLAVLSEDGRAWGCEPVFDGTPEMVMLASPEDDGIAVAVGETGTVAVGTFSGSTWINENPLFTFGAVGEGENGPGSGDDRPGALPREFRVAAIYPNPFNASTRIVIDVAVPGRVTLEIFNTLGRRVALIHDGILRAGRHDFSFDAGAAVSGIYLLRASTEQGVAVTERLTLVK